MRSAWTDACFSGRCHVYPRFVLIGPAGHVSSPDWWESARGPQSACNAILIILYTSTRQMPVYLSWVAVWWCCLALFYLGLLFYHTSPRFLALRQKCGKIGGKVHNNGFTAFHLSSWQRQSPLEIRFYSGWFVKRCARLICGLVKFKLSVWC